MDQKINNRPHISIFVEENSSLNEINGVLLGIEEEQIPYKIYKKKATSAKKLGYDAAQFSPLKVGIGFSNNQITIYYKNLPAHLPYLSNKNVNRTPTDLLKKFGANSGRLVKGVPLFQLEGMEVIG